MFINATWWDLSKESESIGMDRFLKPLTADYHSFDDLIIYKNKEHQSQWLTWLESSLKPDIFSHKDSSIEANFIGELKCDVGNSKKSSSWIYIVHTDIPEDIVYEYNQWYDEEHLPRLVTVPGVNRARRFVCEGQSPKYLTAYSLDDPDAFESPEGLIARKTPWTAKMRSLFFNTRRTMAKKYEFD
jgi:hypothetical protein